MNYRMTLLENNIARFNTSISRTKTSCSILSKEKMLKGAGAYTTFGIKGEIDVYLPLILQNSQVSHTDKTSVDARAIWGTNFHELAHILYSEHNKNSLYGIVRKYDPMILEENRVEFLYFCEFPGTEKWLEYGVLKATNNFNISEEMYRSNDLESVLQMYMLFSARTWIRDIRKRLRNNLVRLWGQDNVQELDRLVLEFCTLRKSEIGNVKCRKIMLDIESLLPDNLYSSNPTPPCPLGHNANNTPSSDYEDNNASNIAKSKTDPDDHKDNNEDNEEINDTENDQNDSSESNDKKEYGEDGLENSDISEENDKSDKSSSHENDEDGSNSEDLDSEEDSSSGKGVNDDYLNEDDNYEDNSVDASEDNNADSEDNSVDDSKDNNADSEECNDEESDVDNDSSDLENSDDKQSSSEENINSSNSYEEGSEESFSEEQGDTSDNQEENYSNNKNMNNHEMDHKGSQSSNNPLGIDEEFMDKQQRDADVDVKNSDTVQYSRYSYFNDTPAMLNISVSQDIVNKKRVMERELESINDEAQSGYLYGLPSGSVNMNVAFNPYRDIDRMFYEWSPGVEDAVGIELVVLVDCSGSMDGQTQKVMESVYPIISAFHDFEGISNINVFAFNESSHTIYNDRQTISPIQVSYPESVGGTDPSQSLYKAVDIFKNSLIERKIMLVFTDGAWNRDFSHYYKILNTIKSFNVSTGYMMYGGNNNDTYKMFDYYVNSNDINDFGKMANTIVMESIKNDMYL